VSLRARPQAPDAAARPAVAGIFGLTNVEWPTSVQHFVISTGIKNSLFLS
jgi:hypothetical protein